MALAFDPLPIDDDVASHWARLRISLRDRGLRMPVNNSWIAATAIALRSWTSSGPSEPRSQVSSRGQLSASGSGSGAAAGSSGRPSCRPVPISPTWW